ncbi:MAG: extracellular solute-binding protein [Actinomycetota bacterium]|nr:extracellular solute-binding protein [Actinomycetota bacterium]
MSRRRRNALILALSSLCVVGFGGASTLANAKGDATNERGTLQIMGFGTPDEVATVRVGRAERDIAPTKLQIIRGGFDQQQFLSAVAAGNPPDLIYVDRQLIGTFAHRRAILPLTSCIRSERFPMNHFRSSAIREVTYRGAVYGIPEFFTNRVVYVNNRALRAAGVKVQDLNTANWTKLRATSRKLMRRSGGKVTRIGFDPKLPEFFPLWAKANGHEIISRDGRRARLDHPKAIQALQFAMSLIDQHGGWGQFKSFRDTWDFFGAKNQVATNQVGAWPMESWYLNVLAQNSPGVSVTLVPFRNKIGNALNWASGNAWAIPRGADDQGAACEWMRTMTRWETWMAAARARVAALKQNNRPFTGLYTGNRVADDRILRQVYEKSGRPGFDQGVATMVRVQRFAWTLPGSPAGAEFQTAWRDAVNRVLNRQQSPAAALRQAQREAQAALNRAG